MSLARTLNFWRRAVTKVALACVSACANFVASDIGAGADQRIPDMMKEENDFERRRDLVQSRRRLVFIILFMCPP